MATLDILLPYYGEPALMRIAVESVLSQDNPDWRLFVLDDAYPDFQIARWLERLNDDRVTFERSPQNLGVNGAFRTLLSRSSAEYVTFFGCDDIMLPSYVDSVRSHIDMFPNAAVIQPGVRVIDAQGRPSVGVADWVKRLLRSRMPEGPALVGGERLASSLLTGNWTYFPSLVWKRSWIADRGFRKGLEVVLDLDLLFAVIVSGGEMVVDPQVVFGYRRHSASVSSRGAADGGRFEEETEFFRLAAEQARAVGWRRADRAARLHLMSRAHRLLKHWCRSNSK